MIKLLKEKIKQNNGFTGQDVLIAIFMIIVFLSLITTITINLSNTSTEISRVKRLTETISKIADKIDSLEYEEVPVTTEAKPVTELQGLTDLKLDTNMEITYTATENTTTHKKEIKLYAKYLNITDIEIPIGKQIVYTSGGTGNGGTGNGGNGTGTGTGTGTGQVITINENSQYPFNRPNHTLDGENSSYNYGYGKPLVPVRWLWVNVTSNKKTGRWVLTNESDLEWYSLEENIWPTFAYYTADTQMGATGYSNKQAYQKYLTYNPFTPRGKSDNKYIFVWLPRILRESNSSTNNISAKYYYAYEKTNNQLSYSDTNGYYENNQQSLKPYNDYLYPYYQRYSRGTIIGWSQEKRNVNSGWDQILNYENSYQYRNTVPETLEDGIKSINRHTNDY